RRALALPSPAQPEAGDDRAVAVDVSPVEVVEEPAALADELEEPSPRGVIAGVRAQVLGEHPDALPEDGDLHFGGGGVGLVRAVLLDDRVLGELRQGGAGASV